MFPNIIIMNYIYFANHLKIAIAKRNFVFNVTVNEKVLSLVRMFLKINIIRRIEKLTPKTYRIYISWYNNQPKLKSLIFYSLGAHPLRLSYSALLVLKTHTFKSNIILSTSKGLLTHHEAIKYHLGGILVCIID